TCRSRRASSASRKSWRRSGRAPTLARAHSRQAENLSLAFLSHAAHATPRLSAPHAPVRRSKWIPPCKTAHAVSFAAAAFIFVGGDVAGVERPVVVFFAPQQKSLFNNLTSP